MRISVSGETLSIAHIRQEWGFAPLIKSTRDRNAVNGTVNPVGVGVGRPRGPGTEIAVDDGLMQDGRVVAGAAIIFNTARCVRGANGEVVSPHFDRSMRVDTAQRQHDNAEHKAKQSTWHAMGNSMKSRVR